ncbi:restriction endonuclease subunit S [Crenobacter cavernae]|uniref:Restriction endonuclease subunit S n=1 Tax=Crenobacter cavernae TaxID=2290923 RepID=A0ABY0FDE2_9NEIS|nr:restriction endonuclease subunit S [Crenobacter cavernae]RXZ42206.1 restriction endonuclease subunit S [Crenobacter cavernae]
MRFKPYAEYRESGVEWIGKVPSHWETWKLSHAFSLIGSGTTPPTLEEQWYEGNVPWVTTGELREDTIVNTNKNLNSDALLKFPTLKKYPAGSVVIAMYGATIGRVGILGVDATTNQACCVLAKSQYLQNRFTFYWLQAFKNEIVNLSSGGGQPNINQEKVTSLRICAPHTNEQDGVAAFLDRETARIDALIDRKQHQIALIAEKRQALITRAVTRGLDSDAPVRDSGVKWLGEVPVHWDVKRLKFNSHLQTGVAKGKDMEDKETVFVPYLRVANVQDGFLALDDVQIIEIEASSFTRYLLKPGDVLMNEGGDNDKLGRGAIWHGEINPCIHQNHVFAIRLDAGFEPEWLSLYTSSTPAKFYFTQLAKQTTNLASISSSNLHEISVTWPPEHERAELLNRVAGETSRLDTLTEKLTRSIELLKEHRAALITAAVTGRIDVRDAA